MTRELNEILGDEILDDSHDRGQADAQLAGDSSPGDRTMALDLLKDAHPIDASECVGNGWLSHRHPQLVVRRGFGHGGADSTVPAQPAQQYALT